MLTFLQKVHDYYQVQFTSGTILSVYNPISFGKTQDLAFFENATVLDIQMSLVQLRIITTVSVIEVSLKDKDYSGPEAYVSSFSDGRIIVE